MSKISPTQALLESEYKLFMDAIERHISPPAQKPASVSGDSGAGLVGNPNLSIGQRVRVAGRVGFVHGFIVEMFGDSVQVSNDFGVVVTVRSHQIV